MIARGAGRQKNMGPEAMQSEAATCFVEDVIISLTFLRNEVNMFWPPNSFPAWFISIDLFAPLFPSFSNTLSPMFSQFVRPKNQTIWPPVLLLADPDLLQQVVPNAGAAESKTFSGHALDGLVKKSTWEDLEQMWTKNCGAEKYKKKKTWLGFKPNLRGSIFGMRSC